MSTSVTRNQLLQQPPAAEVSALTRNGALWTLVVVIGRYVVTLVSSALLARLLTATDYGLIGMVVTFTLFFQVFSDLGLSWATIQRKHITLRQVDNLFWINTAAGAILFMVCIFAGPLLNRFYGRTELAGVATVLGSGFLLSGLAVQPMALLRRRMRLKALSLIEMIAAAIAACVGVSMAFAGFGYWALVGQSLATQLTMMILLFVYTRYIPGMPRANQDTLQMLTFGGYLAAYGLVNYFARNLDNVLIGRVWGAEQLGYYSRAYFLMMFPTYIATASLMGVMVPAMSAVSDDRSRMAATYRMAVSRIGLISFPLVIGLAVTAPETIRLVYGTKWAAVAPLLFWLSIAGVAQPIHNTMGWLYVAVGKTKKMFLWGLIASLVLSLGFFFGVRWGARGVAISYALVTLFVLTIPALYFAHRAADLRLLDTILPLKRAFIASIVMGILVWLLSRVLMAVNAQWGTILFVKIATGILVYTFLCKAALTRLTSDLSGYIRVSHLAL